MSPIVECIKRNGKYKYLFYSNDHEPPHIHVRREGEWEIKVLFLKCTKDHLEYSFVQRARDLKELLRKVQTEVLLEVFPVKDKLYKEWCEKVHKGKN